MAGVDLDYKWTTYRDRTPRMPSLFGHHNRILITSAHSGRGMRGRGIDYFENSGARPTAQRSTPSRTPDNG